MNSRFFIGLLLGVAVTSMVVVFVNYHSMFSTQNIDKQNDPIKQQQNVDKDSSDGVMVLVPNVKMKVAKGAQAVSVSDEPSKVLASEALASEEMTDNKKLSQKKDSKTATVAKNNSSDAIDQIADKMEENNAPVGQKNVNKQIAISVAKYNNLEDADAMVGKLSLLGFSPIINQNQKDYEVILIAANNQEQKLLEQELKKNNINFKRE